MIFYLTHDPTRIHGTQADAKAVSKNFEQIDIPTSKQELMAFVQKLYDQIYDLEQNIRDCTENGEVADRSNWAEPIPAKPTYSEYSLKLEEEFDKLPLAHQLHFAALAMENARERL